MFSTSRDCAGSSRRRLSIGMSAMLAVGVVSVVGGDRVDAQVFASVRPFVVCRDELPAPAKSWLWFGYENTSSVSVTIPVSPSANKITPAPQDRSQTTVFRPGRVERAFAVELKNSGNHTWHLRSPNGELLTATGSSSTPVCPGPLTQLVIGPDVALTPVKTAQEFFGSAELSQNFVVNGTGDTAGASVSVSLTRPLPPQAVSIVKIGKSYLPSEIVASEVYDYALAGDQSVLSSAEITIPLAASVQPSDFADLWVAYQESESGAWVPEEQAPTVNAVARTITVTTNHFSNRIVLKGRPVNGAWTNPFLDAMFGPFPAVCVPEGTPGVVPGGRVAFVFDSSGSIGDANADVQFRAIANRIGKALRRVDTRYVYSDNGTTEGGRVGNSTEAFEVATFTATGGFGTSSSDIGPSLGQLIEVAETDLESPANVLRHVFLFTDDEGIATYFNKSSFFADLTGTPGTWSNLESRGIRLTVIVAGTGPLPGVFPSTFNSPYVSFVRATASTGEEQYRQLKQRLTMLIDDGTDTDDDRLTDCEEKNIFFPNPNFPAAQARPDGAPAVFFSVTNPNLKDSDGDGTDDGAEIIRLRLSSNPVLRRAFANLVSAGVDTFFVARTGRPDSADTDTDGLRDPAAPNLYEACPSGNPSPLLDDTDHDGQLDGVECAQGTNPRANQMSYAQLPWALDYLTAQQQLNADPKWKQAKIATGFARFTTTPALARLGRIRAVGFIPQDETATTPCVYSRGLNVTPVLTQSILTISECTGYLGDGRKYSTSYEEFVGFNLSKGRFILDVDFVAGVWGVAVHPTCERGTNGSGACYSSFPVVAGDLASSFRRLIVNAFGQMRFQAFDVRSDTATNTVTVQGKVIQNDSGLESNLFRPGADFKLTASSDGQVGQLKYDADGFPAAEIFLVRPDNTTRVIANSKSLVGLAPSPFGLTPEELFGISTLIPLGCADARFAKTTGGCVPLQYVVEGPFN